MDDTTKGRGMSPDDGNTADDAGPEALDRIIGDALRERFPKADFPAREVEREIERRVRTLVAEGEAEAAGRRADRGASGGADARADGRWWKTAPLRTLLPAAASVLLFIGGVEYGRRVGGPGGGGAGGPAGATTGQVARAPEAGGVLTGTTPGDALSGDPLTVPISIQSAGSRYVASLARFSSTAGDLSPDQRETAREVAYAIIYSAALELLQESTDDQLLRDIAELVARRRDQFGGEGSPPVSF